MTLEQLEIEVAKLSIEVAKLSVRRLAHREILARLLAHLAASWPDQETILAEFGKAGDMRVDRNEPKTLTQMALAETVRAEIEWIVSAARVMAEGGNLDDQPDPPSE